MSPKNLLVTTITDELRITTGLRSKVIGVALKDRGAILPAGHTANAAYWFDPDTGNFISSSYYMNELPQWVNEFNNEKRAQKYLEQSWTTLHPIGEYSESLEDENQYEALFSGEEKSVFPHNLPAIQKSMYPDKPQRFGLVRQTPFGNTLTKDFALAAIRNEDLGKDDVTDFLTISFSSTDYIGHFFGPYSKEVEDCYLRLDKELAELIDYLEQEVGKNNILIFLTADHGVMDVPSHLKDLRIPSGVFQSESLVDSLKMQLRAINPSFNFEWIDGGQIYVHDTQSRNTATKVIADFFRNTKGVAHVITSSEMENSEFLTGPRHLAQHSFNRRRSGDILVILEPGWMEDYGKPTVVSHGSPFVYDTHVPLLWYGWNIPHGKSTDRVEIIDIAPTLALMLQIPFPNGCNGNPISPLVSQKRD